MKIAVSNLLSTFSMSFILCLVGLSAYAQPGLQLYKTWQNEQWVNYVEYRNYFDESFDGCRIDTAEYKLWNDELSQFDRLNLYVNHFDQNGNIVREETQQVYNGDYVGYIDNYKFYNANNLLEYDSSMVYSIIDDSWSVNGKSVYTYDSELNEIEQLTYTWMNGWVPSSRQQSTYTGLGLISESIFSYYSGTDWLEASKQVYTYDGDLLLSNTYSQLQGGVWQEQYENVYTYNGQGQSDTCRFFTINPDGSQELSFLTTYIYDGENLSQVLDQSVMNGVTTNSQLNILSEYCTAPVGLNEAQIEELAVYPIPATDEICIRFKTETTSPILLFNASGQCVKRVQSVNAPLMRLDVSDLAPGVYSLVLAGENAAKYSQTLVIE